MNTPSQLGRWSLVVVFAASAISCASRQPAPRPDGGDSDESLMMSAAATAFDRGDLPLARAQYRRALDRARAINSANMIADAAYDVAVCEVGLGQFDAAALLLREAEYDASRGGGDLLDIVLLRAKVAYFRGDLAGAAKLAARIIDSDDRGSRRLQANILQARILCQQGSIPAAEMRLGDIDRSIAKAPANVSASTRADVENLRGSIARDGKKDLPAAACFDRESEFLRQAHRYKDMAQATSRAGDAYLAGNKPGVAADRFFLAARSAAAQGDVATARRLAGSSISAANQAGDAATRDLAAGLLKSLTDPAGP